VKVVYFASARDVVGMKAERVDRESGATVAGILDRLVDLHPELKLMRGSLRISVNQEVAEPGAPVKDGDEVGVLPPVAGG
jgi:molybdopterin converting factor subunit 1